MHRLRRAVSASPPRLQLVYGYYSSVIAPVGWMETDRASARPICQGIGCAVARGVAGRSAPPLPFPVSGGRRAGVTASSNPVEASNRGQRLGGEATRERGSLAVADRQDDFIVNDQVTDIVPLARVFDFRYVD